MPKTRKCRSRWKLFSGKMSIKSGWQIKLRKTRANWRKKSRASSKSLKLCAKLIL